MNFRQRMKNRMTARLLLTPCPECGKLYDHFVIIPPEFPPLLSMKLVEYNGHEGFWTCDKFYDENGRRIECL